MKEIGGYLEFEKYCGTLFHENAAMLDSGRSALRCLINAKGIKKLYIPAFCCDTVADSCRKENIEFEYYGIDADFRPVFTNRLSDGEWLYIVNYYGQLTNGEISDYKAQFCRVIADNTQAYFQEPVPNVDTIYTCRKYFGVSDGAFLYTDTALRDLPVDESFERIHFVTGRFERTASEFYKEAADNNNVFSKGEPKRMSLLTENLLRSFDYEKIKKIRADNFTYLNEKFCGINKLHPTIPVGAFMYPLYLKDGMTIKKALAKKKIYIPTLWPDVFDICDIESLEYDYAENILPLPVDQRYNIEDMNIIINEIKKCLNY